MKKIFLLTTIVTFLMGGSVVFNSCSKSIDEQNMHYPMINPTRVDANAGSWKPILLTTANEFACATPIATTSPDYVIQLNEIKSFQNQLTTDERKLVEYWGAGAVLRWNEIMRELVALTLPLRFAGEEDTAQPPSGIRLQVPPSASPVLRHS